MTILPFPQLPPSDLAQIAERRLQASPYYFLRRLTCTCRGAAVTLHGRVPIEALRDCAESIVARIDGVEAVVNCIEVGEPVIPLHSARAQRNAG